MGAREVGPWVGEPLGKSPLRGNPNPESTYLPTSICDRIFILKPALSICNPSVLHWISKPFIHAIHILFLLYLLLWFGFSTSKPTRFHQNHLGTNQGHHSEFLVRT